MEQKKKVYTVEEVREILGIGKNKAYELCNNQTFPVLRIGSRILIPIRTFEDWLYSGAVLIDRVYKKGKGNGNFVCGFLFPFLLLVY